MRLSRWGVTYCVQCLSLFVPNSCTNLDEFSSIEIPQRPDARLNSILGRFCNFLQVKTTASPTTCQTRHFMFKFGSASTKFLVYAKPDIENRIHKASEQLIKDGFHKEYVAKQANVRLNNTSFGMGLIKSLLAGVKELLPSDYFVDP